MHSLLLKGCMYKHYCFRLVICVMWPCAKTDLLTDVCVIAVQSVKFVVPFRKISS